MFGIGETELLIIVAFAFMVFGPDKLPGMGRTIGRALRQFREAQEGFTQVVQAEVVDPLNDAMNEPTARKRAQAAAEARADDADRDDADAPATQRRQETFAERKARLRAEREAREGAAAPSAADAPTSAPPDGERRAEAAASAASSAAGDGPQEQADTSAAALYALTPRRDAAALGNDPGVADAASADAAAVTKTPRSAAAPMDGEEAGGAA